MNAQEAAALCRYTKALCPQQAIDVYTPDVWLDVLHWVRFEDAKAAVVTVASAQPFVSPSEIVREVRRVRTKRLHQAGDLTPPPGLEPVETNAWLSQARRRIADGETVDQVSAYGELKPRHLPDLRALLPKVDPVEDDDAAAS